MKKMITLLALILLSTQVMAKAPQVKFELLNSNTEMTILKYQVTSTLREGINLTHEANEFYGYFLSIIEQKALELDLSCEQLGSIASHNEDGVYEKLHLTGLFECDGEIPVT